MEGLINIKNNDNKFFLWYHIRHLNPLKHPERITKTKKKMVSDRDCEGIESPVPKKILLKLKKETIFALISFVMKIN